MKNNLLKIFVLLFVIGIAIVAIFVVKSPKKAVMISASQIEKNLTYNPIGSQKRGSKASVGVEPTGLKNQEHYHAILRVQVNRIPYTLNQYFGIFEDGQASQIHTHDKSGVVHFHRPLKRSAYKLNDLMLLWGKKYDQKTFGDFKHSQGWDFNLYQNGKKYPWGTNIILKDKDDVVLVMSSVESDPQLELSKFDWNSVPLRDQKKYRSNLGL